MKITLVSNASTANKGNACRNYRQSSPLMFNNKALNRDVVTFCALGDKKALTLKGAYDVDGDVHLKSIKVDTASVTNSKEYGNINVDGKLKVDDYIDIHGSLNVRELEAKTAKIGHNAKIAGKAKADEISTFFSLEAGELEAKNVQSSSKVLIAGKAKIADSISVSDALEADELEAKTANIRKYAKIAGKAKVDNLVINDASKQYLFNEYFLEAGELEAKTANIRNYAKIAGKAKADEISTGKYLEADELEVKTATVGDYTHITGDANVGELTTRGDLKIGGVSNIQKAVSIGDVELGPIKKLDELFILENPEPVENVKRTLTFNSSEIESKIKVVLGDISELVVHTVDENVLNKMEFFHAAENEKGSISEVGKKVSNELLKQVVKVIKK